MDILTEHFLPIGGFLILILALYAAERILRRRQKKEGRRGILPDVFAYLAPILTLALLVYLLTLGAGIELLLPVLLLTLLAAIL